jgi:hypothetical protein
MAGIAAVLAVIGSGLPFADAAPVRKSVIRMTCADFLAFEDAVKPEVVYWAAIHDRDGHRLIDPVDVDATDRIVPIVTRKCRTDSGQSLWQTVDLELGSFGKHALEQSEGRARAD